MVYVGSQTGKLYALDLADGHEVWETNVGAPITGPDERNAGNPLSGLGAGQGLLVVPAGTQLSAYGA